MKSIAALALIGSAAAFAPSQSVHKIQRHLTCVVVALCIQASTALKVNELELGATEPLGVFDPLGWIDTQPESFERRRAVERKHGRIAMAAVVGTIVHNNHIVFDG